MIKLYLDLIKKTLSASIYDESSWSIICYEQRGKGVRKFWYFLKNIPKIWLVGLLLKRSIFLLKKRLPDSSEREEGKDWPLFGYTMVGHKRLENVQKCFEEVVKHKIPGDLVETGAWRGGTTIFMRALLKAHGIKERKVWVADSFEGLPVPKNKEDGLDLSEVEYLKVSLEEVKKNFERFDLLDEQVVFLKGWFCDTLATAPIENIAILRLDGDLYSSTMDALQNLYTKVSEGGYIIIDDYYSWPSCRKAVTDFRNEKRILSEIKKIDWSGIYWRKE